MRALRWGTSGRAGRQCKGDKPRFRQERLSSRQRNNQENSKSKSQAGQRRSAAPFQEPVTKHRPGPRPEPRLEAWASRRHGTGIEHSVRFTGTRYHGPRARLRPSACAASCPDRVLARRPVSGLLRQLQRATFSPPRFQPHRLVAECSATKACISWNKEATCPRATACCPTEEQTPIYLAIRALSDTLSPRHTRHPLHEAANYLYNRYRYL